MDDINEAYSFSEIETINEIDYENDKRNISESATGYSEIPHNTG